ncbi:diguanylate cyclase domain-containing protein [Blastococcus haudaquaticus]|uniref:Cyclic di-GMP phosphodiesterase Gmr n=1 Tax=Blastococcus haudaquaticus TaxID=1938745 RepID=A0A286H8N4_9ACTN|nr:diguanylate cyclase [Blastococcus haudaquaticus]SOE03826.1 cyclic di-GMP phosphodiesterase Gmr [Blastococcus haudaquaticus]
MTVQPEVAQAPDQLLRDFVDASDALLCIVDGDGRILLTNPALQRFTGRTGAELAGRLFWDVYVVPEHAALSQDAVARAMATGTAYPQEGDWLTGTGERRRVAMRNTVLRDDEGRPYAVGCVGLDVTDDRRREAQLHRRAQTDLLTGIANRGALFDALRTRLADGADCSLLFCDLDQFKAVNDRYGHAVGDALLAEVAQRMATVVGPGHLVARFGGDEFVIVCHGRAEDELAAMADRVFDVVRAPFEGPRGPLSIGVSIGIAVGRPGDDADELIGRADRAMYGAKMHPHRRSERPRRSEDPGR